MGEEVRSLTATTRIHRIEDCDVPQLDPLVANGECEEDQSRDEDGNCQPDGGGGDKDGDPYGDNGRNGGGGGGGNNGDEDGERNGGEGGERDTTTFAIDLECTPETVERGETVVCDANPSNTNEGTVTYEWTFRPMGQVRIWDHGGDKDHVVGRDGDHLRRSVLEGTAVYGGLVKVTATLSDSAQDESGLGKTFTVTPRGWTVDKGGFASGPDLTSYLVGDVPLGRNTDSAGSAKTRTS